jgi:diguanylate cyclase (GGDEF)-like protein
MAGQSSPERHQPPTQPRTARHRGRLSELWPLAAIPATALIAGAVDHTGSTASPVGLPWPVVRFAIACAATVAVGVVMLRPRQPRGPRYRAITDPLTGLHNRTYLHRRFRRWNALMPAQGVLIATIDIGQQPKRAEPAPTAPADRVIQDVAGRLRHAVDANDILARVDSNRFVLVCGNVGTKLAAAQRCQGLVEAACGALWAPRDRRRVTACVGAAWDPHGQLSPADLALLADEQLRITQQYRPRGYTLSDTRGVLVAAGSIESPS